MRRVAVIGSASGSGKTTVARALAARLDVPFTELDALNHRAGWIEASPAELRALVAPIVAKDAWVIDGGYQGKLGDLVLERAELVVWLDLPRRVWLPRLVTRTARRVVTREKLWAGNRETLRGALVGRDSLFRFAWRNFGRRRREYPARLARFRAVRLRTQREVDAFLRSVSPVSSRSDFSRTPARCAARCERQVSD